MVRPGQSERRIDRLIYAPAFEPDDNLRNRNLAAAWLNNTSSKLARLLCALGYTVVITRHANIVWGHFFP